MQLAAGRNRIERDCTRGVEAIDGLVTGFVRSPSRWTCCQAATDWAVLVGLRPRWAALMRSAASLDTTHVGPYICWPRAAPMIRLSGTEGSRPCSINRCFCTPLISIFTVLADEPSPTGVASASEPPALTRSSSSVLSAVRAARPTSSTRLFNPSSSSITVSGMTTSAPTKLDRQDGSATRTEVSSTIRVRTPPLTSTRRAWVGTRSVNATPIVCSG